jgi:hypothetical protein
VALERWKVSPVNGAARQKLSRPELDCDLGGLPEIIMGRNQTEFGEVGAKAVREVAVEKKMTN